MLILSFSPIIGDARVLKQVALFRGDYRVTTCGYGPAPDGVEEHIRIPDDIAHNVLHDGLIRRRRYRRQYWSLWSVTWVWRALRRRSFDVALANDIEAVPIALRLEPAHGVHADLHEYSPLLHEDWQGWREKVTPYHEWVCREYVARASSWTTVSHGLAREYERQFGFRPEIVTNAAPFADVEPKPVTRPIRLVHSGAALQDRRLEDMIAGVAASSSDVTLDVYLTPNQPAYVDQLRAQAASAGARIAVHDPVPYSSLASTLQRYDIGLSILPPTTFNIRWSLPNKFFDYVQARLAVAVGPSPEMMSYVEELGLGFVTTDFSAESLTAALDALTPENVERWKAASHEHARALSADVAVEGWRTALRALMS